MFHGNNYCPIIFENVYFKYSSKAEKYALENDVPIMQKDGIDFLTNYIKENNIKNIFLVLVITSTPLLNFLFVWGSPIKVRPNF